MHTVQGQLAGDFLQIICTNIMLVLMWMYSAYLNELLLCGTAPHADVGIPQVLGGLYCQDLSELFL